MAETPLTDSIEALTTYANQVTGASDINLSDAVYTLAQGYGGGGGFNLFRYLYNGNEIIRNVQLPSNVVLDFDGNTTLTAFGTNFYATSGLVNLTIKNLQSTKTNLSFNSFCYNSSDIETITFENCSFAPLTLESFCRASPKLTTITGEIDCTNATNLNQVFAGFTPVVDFRIKRNTISVSPTSNWGTADTWSNTSFVSLANGFNPNVSGTFKLTANQIAKCATIIGTVTDGLFVEDASGSVTLSDFIANTKGWTLTT